MKKILLITIAIIAVITALLFSAKNIIAKSLLENGVYSFTGLKLSTGDVNVDFFNNRIRLKNLSLSNPEGFAQEAMAVIPEIYINYDLWAFFTGRVYLKEMRLYIAKLVVTRNREGKLNIQVAQETIQKNTAQARFASIEGKERNQKPEATWPKINIDVLVVKLGSISYKESLNSGLALAGTIELNSEEHYENISSKQQLFDAILGQVTKSEFGGFDLQGFYSDTKEDFKNIGNVFKKEFKGIGDSFKKMFSAEED